MSVITTVQSEVSGEQGSLTKKDLQTELAFLKAEMQAVKWMNGLVLCGVVVLILMPF